MRVSGFLSAALALHVLLTVRCVPLHRGRGLVKHKEPSGLSQISSSQSENGRGQIPHPQDTFIPQARPQEEVEFSSPFRNGFGATGPPRCGVPDYPDQKEMHLDKHNRQKRFVIFGGRWDKKHLTYKIQRIPVQMNKDKVRRVLQEALKVWSDVTPLTFTEVVNQKADIVIDFIRKWHGDDLPFDGRGGILAHAFFPQTHREGDIHFDSDEYWTVGNDLGTDLLQVAAHEFGHVLGLKHSLEPGAIMSPFYSVSYPLRLSEDDKKGIQYLYGSRKRPPLVTENNEIPNAVTPFHAPDTCHTDFDAVSIIRGELFFFKASYAWRIRDGRLQAGYPALASRHWSGFPQKISAAYEDKKGDIWFFEGSNYWVFDAEHKITGPNPLSNIGLPVTDIEAALRLKEHNGHSIYLFKSGNYWRLDPQENRVDSVTPHRIQNYWRGAPDEIDAAFQDINDFTVIFISRLQYWKFDPVRRTVLPGYPRYIGADFFGCNMP